jgi:hypothetical protein
VCCITWDAATNRYHLFFSRDVLSTYSQQFKGWSDEQFMQFLGKMVAPFTVHLKWIWHPAISFSMDWIFQREKKTTLHLSRKDETNDQQICWCHENYSHIPLYISHYLWLVISACSIHPQLIYRHEWMHCITFMWHLSNVWCCQITYRVSKYPYISYYIIKFKKKYWNVNYLYFSRDFTAFYLVGG